MVLLVHTALTKRLFLEIQCIIDDELSRTAATNCRTRLLKLKKLMGKTNFLQKFVFHMLLFPCLVCVSGSAYVFAKKTKFRAKYTKESLWTQLITIVFLVAFTLYTGVSTRIFQLFKCRQIQDKWYLEADFSIDCNDNEYVTHVVFAFFFVYIYVVGLPLVEGVILWRNRRNLYANDCVDAVVQRRMEKEFGSIYAQYNPNTYFFDVIDLVRRLLLTGGLILMGNESVGQLFLGILICTFWLC